MTIRHLKTFILVCETGCISKAAEELCVAQPSVSQTIKELECYYNVTLFIRDTHKLTITKEGEILLAKAKEIVSSFNDFEALARQIDTKPDVNIGATMAFGEYILPTFLDVIQKEIKRIDPHLIIDKPDGLVDKILKGDLDFAIVEGLISSKNIRTHAIGNDRLVAICSANYNAPSKLKLEELLDYDLLVREEGSPSRRILDYQLAIKGKQITKTRTTSISNMVLLSLAVNGLGIAILPHDIVKKELENGTIKEIKLDTSLDRKLFLISHKNKKFNSSVKC